MKKIIFSLLTVSLLQLTASADPLIEAAQIWDQLQNVAERIPQSFLPQGQARPVNFDRFTVVNMVNELNRQADPQRFSTSRGRTSAVLLSTDCTRVPCLFRIFVSTEYTSFRNLGGTVTVKGIVELGRFDGPRGEPADISSIPFRVGVLGPDFELDLQRANFTQIIPAPLFNIPPPRELPGGRNGFPGNFPPGGGIFVPPAPPLQGFPNGSFGNIGPGVAVPPVNVPQINIGNPNGGNPNNGNPNGGNPPNFGQPGGQTPGQGGPGGQRLGGPGNGQRP